LSRFPAVTAIQVAHRIGAVVLTLAVLGFAAHLASAGARRWAGGLLALLGWQVVSGVSNVVLGWPLAAALAHSAGAAGWVVLMATLGCRLRAVSSAPAGAVQEARA
ncbi:MAG: COX15/CtaA family protein, partial [Inhella sp.]